MVSSCKVPLPPGKIGVTFKGNPPVVAAITEYCPLIGKIKEGYVFEGLYLQDGTEFTNLSTSDLVQALDQHMDEEGRKMKLKMMIPDATSLSLPAGDVGLTIEGTPPIITKVSDETLQLKIKAGLAVDAIILEDGTKYFGLSAEDLYKALNDDYDSEGRVLSLINLATSKLSSASITLPASKIVILPTGDLGTTYEGIDQSVISKMTDDSPMHGIFRVGLVVDALTLPDGTTFSGLNSADLSTVISMSADIQGRTMCLMNPASKNLAKKPTTKVLIPDGNLGLTLRGTPAVVVAVADDSPLAGKVRPGVVLETICLPDQTEFDFLDGEEATETLSSSDIQGGWMCFAHNALPDELEVPLPSGPLGVTFKGLPGKSPLIASISENSPLIDFVKVGLAVDILTLDDGVKLCEMNIKELTDALSKSTDNSARKILFKNPATTVMTKKGSITLPAKREVILPSREKLGFMMYKGPQAIISGVSDDSPIRFEIMPGLAIDTITLPDGQVFMELDSTEVIHILDQTKDSEGRVLLLKDLSLGNMTKKPDSKEVALPAGRLDTVFQGTPPVITKLNKGCPLKKELSIGFFVDMITLDDGTVISGLSASELVEVLKESSHSKGRTLLLKNPATKKPSARATILPDEKEVYLPVGFLGVSFKGTPPQVSRLTDESPLLGRFRVGMIVDSLTVPNGGAENKIYAGMSSIELVKVIRASSGTTGRTIVLKNKDTAVLSERKGDFSDEPDIDMDASVRG